MVQRQVVHRLIGALCRSAKTDLSTCLNTKTISAWIFISVFKLSDFMDCLLLLKISACGIDVTGSDSFSFYIFQVALDSVHLHSQVSNCVSDIEGEENNKKN